MDLCCPLTVMSGLGQRTAWLKKKKKTNQGGLAKSYSVTDVTSGNYGA